MLPSGDILVPSAQQLVALSPAGVHLWTQDLPGVPTSPVTANGDRVYVGDMSGGVSAIDVTGGKSHRLVWTVQAGSGSYGSVVATGTGRLYTTADSGLVAVDDHGSTGKVAWRANPSDGITEVSAGLAADGTAILGTNGKREWAYHPDGTRAWDSPRTITYSSPSVHRERPGLCR